MKNRKGITLIEVLVGVAILLIIAVIIWAVLSGGAGVLFHGNVYSTGYRDGFIRKLADKGNVIKAWEVEVGFHGWGNGPHAGKAGQPESGGTWCANIMEEEVYNQAKMIRGDQLVRIFYREVRFKWEGATDYRVDRIVPLPPAGEIGELYIERTKDK